MRLHFVWIFSLKTRILAAESGTKCTLQKTFFFSIFSQPPFLYLLSSLFLPYLYFPPHTNFFTFCLLSSFNTFLSKCVSHITGSTQYPHFNKVIFVSHSFLPAMRLCLMAHQELKPTSAPTFETAFSSLCWLVTPWFSSRIKMQFILLVSTVAERWDLVLELRIADSVIWLLKHNGQFGKFTIASNGNIDNALSFFFLQKLLPSYRTKKCESFVFGKQAFLKHAFAFHLDF